MRVSMMLYQQLWVFLQLLQLCIALRLWLHPLSFLCHVVGIPWTIICVSNVTISLTIDIIAARLTLVMPTCHTKLWHS